MRYFIVTMVVAALFSSSPLLAADKKVKKESASAETQDSTEGRGGLKEWPVSKEEADWSSAAASSAGKGKKSDTAK